MIKSDFSKSFIKKDGHKSCICDIILIKLKFCKCIFSKREAKWREHVKNRYNKKTNYKKEDFYVTKAVTSINSLKAKRTTIIRVDNLKEFISFLFFWMRKKRDDFLAIYWSYRFCYIKNSDKGRLKRKFKNIHIFYCP